MSVPATLLDDGFREEEDILVYVSNDALQAAHSIDWFFDELAKRGAQRILVDIRANSVNPDRNRRVVYRRHRELDGRKVAILGRSRVQEFLISFLIAATGHTRSRYFTEEGAARAWLRGDA